MNKVIIKGNLTRDPEIKQTQSNIPMARFTVGVRRETKNKDGSYDSDFINCVAYHNNAELLERYFTKGNAILILGHLQTGSYEKENGQRVYTTDVVVERIEFVAVKIPEDKEEVKLPF